LVKISFYQTSITYKAIYQLAFKKPALLLYSIRGTKKTCLIKETLRCHAFVQTCHKH